MRIDILGCRGSTPSPGAEFVRYGGETSSIAISPDGRRPCLLLDAGTGLRHLDALLGQEPFRGTVLLSHLHWDHTHGLPFARSLDRHDACVDLYLPAQGQDAEQLLARVLAPPHFPIQPNQLRGAWSFDQIDEGRHRFEGFDVLACEIPHKGGRTFGYRISDANSSIAYLPDHHPGPPGAGPSGLGEFHATALQLARDVDLLIHDGQFTAAEYGRRSPLGHATVEYAVELGLEASARSVLLFHHDPGRTDDQIDNMVDELIEMRRPQAITIRAATQGMTVIPRR